MNARLTIGAIVVLVLVAIVGFASIYVVDPTRSAIVFRFGQRITTSEEPGIYFKLPLIDNVVYIDQRILDLDTPRLEVFAEGQSRLVVDAFARYRVIDPLQFYTSNNSGNITFANARLSDLLTSAVRDVLAASTILDIVSQNRAQLMAQITQRVNAQARAGQFGVEVVDVRIRRADLPEAISQPVFNRMRTQRQQEAAQLRAQGEEAARTIRAAADRNATVTVALANQQAEATRGDGDAQANRILAEAYGADPEFFAFYRSMQAYQQALQAGTTTMVLTPNSAFFRFFNQFAGADVTTPAAPVDGAAPPPGLELPPPLELTPVPDVTPPAPSAAPVTPAPAPVDPTPPAPAPEAAPPPAPAPAEGAAPPPVAP